MTDRKGLADRLEAIAFDDHERGCEGRNYLCSCGFDDREHDVLKEAAAALRQEPTVDEVAELLYPIIASAADFNDQGYEPYEVALADPHGDPWLGYAREAAQAIASLYRDKP